MNKMGQWTFGTEYRSNLQILIIVGKLEKMHAKFLHEYDHINV